MAKRRTPKGYVELDEFGNEISSFDASSVEEIVTKAKTTRIDSQTESELANLFGEDVVKKMDNDPLAGLPRDVNGNIIDNHKVIKTNVVPSVYIKN